MTACPGRKDRASHNPQGASKYFINTAGTAGTLTVTVDISSLK